MRGKYIRLIVYGVVALGGFGYSFYKEYFSIVGITGIVLILAEFCLGQFLNNVKDFFVGTGWKNSLKALQQRGIVKEDDYIRISFAYLFRIKIGDRYFLVKNERGTQKYQPVGGAYKFQEIEKKYLKKEFSPKDDMGIKIDEKSKNDYRMYVRAKNLKKFIKRFDKTPYREQINDLSREIKEELCLTCNSVFNNISYRYCGRHFTEIEYSRVFRCYELLLADIVELNLSEAQERYLNNLVTFQTNKFMLTTVQKIKSCGIEAGTENLLENIADHTIKILQETEPDLIKIRKYMKNDYTINI